MTKDLQRRLRSLRSAERELTPDPAWVAQTREALVLKISTSGPIRESKTARRQTWKALWQLIPSQFIQWVRRPVFASLAAIVGLAGGSLMSVSAAERSMPGDFFYGLKLATEQARLALTSAKDEKLKLKTEFTGRRVEELKQVADAKQDNHVVEVAEILKRDLDTMKNQLIEVSNEESVSKTADVARLVDKKSGEVISALQQAKPQLPPEAIEKVMGKMFAEDLTGQHPARTAENVEYLSGLLLDGKFSHIHGAFAKADHSHPFAFEFIERLEIPLRHDPPLIQFLIRKMDLVFAIAVMTVGYHHKIKMVLL